MKFYLGLINVFMVINLENVLLFNVLFEPKNDFVSRSEDYYAWDDSNEFRITVFIWHDYYNWNFVITNLIPHELIFIINVIVLRYEFL